MLRIQYSIFVVVLFCVFVSPPAESEIDFHNNFYGLNYQRLDVNDINEGEDLDMHVGDIAHAIGLYFKSVPHQYIQLEVGVDGVYIRDDSPFTETVNNNRGEGTSSKRSNVLGYALYIEGGLTFPLSPFQRFEAIRYGVMLGYRYNDIDRTIFRCEGCQYQALDSFKSSAYLKPFIEYHYSTYLHGQFYFSHYFNDAGFSNGVGVQISFYVP